MNNTPFISECGECTEYLTACLECADAYEYANCQVALVTSYQVALVLLISFIFDVALVTLILGKKIGPQ